MQDIYLDSNNDLSLKNGDFVIEASTLQHQNHIVLAQKGEYKQYPEIGVGILTELLNENPRELLNQIRRNFEYDGMQVTSLKITTNGNIAVDAVYK